MTPRRAKMKLPFPRKLVLNRWVLGEFGIGDLCRPFQIGSARNPARVSTRATCTGSTTNSVGIPREQRPRLPDDALLAP